MLLPSRLKQGAQCRCEAGQELSVVLLRLFFLPMDLIIGFILSVLWQDGILRCHDDCPGLVRSNHRRQVQVGVSIYSLLYTTDHLKNDSSLDGSQFTKAGWRDAHESGEALLDLGSIGLEIEVQVVWRCLWLPAADNLRPPGLGWDLPPCHLNSKVALTSYNSDLEVGVFTAI